MLTNTQDFGYMRNDLGSTTSYTCFSINLDPRNYEGNQRSVTYPAQQRRAVSGLPLVLYLMRICPSLVLANELWLAFFTHRVGD